jgi:hypothetical protein
LRNLTGQGICDRNKENLLFVILAGVQELDTQKLFKQRKTTQAEDAEVEPCSARVSSSFRGGESWHKLYSIALPGKR